MNQRGFTLLELLVAMAVGGVLLLAIVTGILEIEAGKWQITGKSVALVNIDSAAHWLVRDIPMAQATDLVDWAPPVDNMTITCNDLTSWAADEGSVSHTVTYTHSGTQLLRNYDGEVTTVGKYITNVGFSINGTLVTVTLTSYPGTDTRSSVTKRYLIHMRPGSSS